MLILPRLFEHRGRISSALGTLSKTWSSAFHNSHLSDYADLHPRDMTDSEHFKLTSATARQPVGPEVLLVHLPFRLRISYGPHCYSVYPSAKYQCAE